MLRFADVVQGVLVGDRDSGLLQAEGSTDWEIIQGRPAFTYTPRGSRLQIFGGGKRPRAILAPRHITAAMHLFRIIPHRSSQLPNTDRHFFNQMSGIDVFADFIKSRGSAIIGVTPKPHICRYLRDVEVRGGHLTAVDARGREWHIPIRSFFCLWIATWVVHPTGWARQAKPRKPPRPGDAETPFSWIWKTQAILCMVFGTRSRLSWPPRPNCLASLPDLLRRWDWGLGAGDWGRKDSEPPAPSP